MRTALEGMITPDLARAMAETADPVESMLAAVLRGVEQSASVGGRHHVQYSYDPWPAVVVSRLRAMGWTVVCSRTDEDAAREAEEQRLELERRAAGYLLAGAHVANAVGVGGQVVGNLGGGNVGFVGGVGNLAVNSYIGVGQHTLAVSW